ncbi:MAG: TetR family transcriptional regulator, partial [Methyloprofundus sp.]|nr:TetR family transcriptional regulator [Methyloprofundus sp.]
DKVAQSAPVSKATLYKYFASKNDLLAAVIDELCGFLWQTMEDAPIDSESIEYNLKQIATAFVDLIFSKEGLAIYRLVVAECYDFPELGKLVHETGSKSALSQLEQYLNKINQCDQVNMTDLTFAADSFFSLLKGDLHFQCLLGIKAPPSVEEKRVLINQVVTFYIQGFLYAKP